MKEKFAFLLLNTVSTGIFQVNGVRGKCAFSSLGDWFDIVMGFVPDYMHCVLQGITKTLPRLCFSPVYKHHDFFIGDKVSSEVTHLVCIRIFNLVKCCHNITQKFKNFLFLKQLGTFLR